jgi:hypothetical protein
MLVYSKVEAQQTLQFLVSLNAETGGSIQGACLLVMAQRPAQLLGLPVTRSFIFLIKNSPDQVEGYLDYLQPEREKERERKRERKRDFLSLATQLLFRCDFTYTSINVAGSLLFYTHSRIN